MTELLTTSPHATWLRTLVLTLSVCSWLVSARAEPVARAEVTSLPGLAGSLSSRLYSGYLLANKTYGRYLFYLYAESQSSPETDPLLFWTNGGPGCSAMEGFWKEHGPYLVRNSEGGVRHNPYTWNKAANMLYIEHPVGVGFSYSNDTSDYGSNNDYRTASDLYNALQHFRDLFPSAAARDLYVGGESYGGEYVPHLVHTIAFGPDPALRARLRGMVLGNPVFNCQADRDGTSHTLQLQMLFFHGLLPYQGPYSEWFAEGCDKPAKLSPAGEDECGRIMGAAQKQVGYTNQQIHRSRRRALRSQPSHFPVDPYDQDTPLSKIALASAPRHGPSTEPSAEEAQARGRGLVELKDEPDFDPDHKYQSFCLDNNTLEFATQPNWNDASCHPLGDPGRLSEWLNRADVQAALHISHPPPLYNGKWTDCAGGDGVWRYKTSGVNVLTAYYEPLLEALPADSFRVFVFSGDEDIATVPYPNTQVCLSELAATLPKVQEWTPYRHSGILIGYWEASERITFATVKGAGHTVPQYQPLAGYEMIARWLAHGNLTMTD